MVRQQLRGNHVMMDIAEIRKKAQREREGGMPTARPVPPPSPSVAEPLEAEDVSGYEEYLAPDEESTLPAIIPQQPVFDQPPMTLWRSSWRGAGPPWWGMICWRTFAPTQPEMPESVGDSLFQGSRRDVRRRHHGAQGDHQTPGNHRGAPCTSLYCGGYFAAGDHYPGFRAP